jgi:hypothetical protein
MLRFYPGRFNYVLEGIGYFADWQIWQNTMDKVFCLVYGALPCEDVETFSNINLVHKEDRIL